MFLRLGRYCRRPPCGSCPHAPGHGKCAAHTAADPHGRQPARPRLTLYVKVSRLLALSSSSEDSVAASICGGVSSSSILSASAKCFFASTRFPTRR